MAQQQRRLAAILAADVAGYSRLMASDETGTLERFKALKNNVVARKIAQYHGTVVGTAGDSLLVEFASAVEAVQCAVETQCDIAAQNESEPEDRRIEFRMGVNLGDVIAEDGTIHGDGVNVASRLEKLAEPGTVVIARSVHDQIKGKLSYDYEDLGEQRVKNIDEPLHVYRVAGQGRVAAHSGGPIFPRRHSKPTVAVLPFANMSADPEQEYFSDGLTEDLTTELSRFKELSVVSRNSAFVFKGKPESIKSVGEKLNAQYLVEGSVRRSGDRIRVTAQLIDAQNDQHIWAERYDRTMEDIFHVQDDVVRRVASTLVDRLEFENKRKKERQSSSQLQAYDLYLRARECFFSWTMESNNRAAEWLRSALDLEPDYAAALALLSEVLLRMWLNGWSEHAEQDLEESFALAKRADALDDQDSRTQLALALSYLFHRQLDHARRHFDAALSLNPNDTRVLIYYARHAIFDGYHDKAVELCRQARELNPFGKYDWNLGLAYFAARQYDAAIASLEAIKNPAEVVLALLAGSYAMADRGSDARRTYDRFAVEIQESPVMSNLESPEHWRIFFSARWPFRNADDLAHLLEAMGKAGFPV